MRHVGEGVLTVGPGWAVSVISTLFVMIIVSGCQRPAQPTQPTTTFVEAGELDALWDAALRILRRHDFQPDRQDRTAGIITTLPSTSMQWHEPWRQDVAEGYGLLMASLHTIQRQVTIRFIRQEEWSMDVQVDVYLLSASDYQITSSSAGIRSFSGDLPTVTGEKVMAADTRRWIHLGRDASMEERLLNRILTY